MSKFTLVLSDEQGVQTNEIFGDEHSIRVLFKNATGKNFQNTSEGAWLLWLLGVKNSGMEIDKGNRIELKDPSGQVLSTGIVGFLPA
jgi:hypothetical protein